MESGGMRRFIRKALEKIGKLDQGQIAAILLSLAEENDLLAMVLESMTDGIVVTDKEHHVILFNKSAERLLPFMEGDILEKLLWERLSDKEIAAFFKDILSKQENAADRQFMLEDGAPRILSLSILPLVRGGASRGTSFTWRT